MAGGDIFGQHAGAHSARLSASAAPQPRRRLEGGGLKVAARTSSADRKREQGRDLGRKEGWMGHGNLV